MKALLLVEFVLQTIGTDDVDKPRPPGHRGPPSQTIPTNLRKRAGFWVTWAAYFEQITGTVNVQPMNVSGGFTATKSR